MVQFFDRGRSPWYTTGHLGLGWFKLLEESQADALQGFGFGAGFVFAFAVASAADGEYSAAGFGLVYGALGAGVAVLLLVP